MIIIKINPKKPEKELIRIASDFIKHGKLVAFPTETVYGLGASALSKKSVSKIFKAKGRPSDNPLIVHVSSKKDVDKLAKVVPRIAFSLMDRFWPGPLTFVLEKKSIIPGNVTAGLKTVAIRMPNNKIALELIKKSGPIAAPSANLSGKPSGTSVKHVIQDFNGKIDCIVDGGNTKIGLESTVVDLTTNPPLLLRPGFVTLEQLRRHIPNIQVKSKIKSGEKVSSPGMKYRHYAPRAKVVVTNDVIKAMRKYSGKKIKIIDIKNNVKLARKIFGLFREADEKKYDVVIVKAVKEKGLGLAIMNRLRKASSSHR